jgi:hypothetical protein
MRKHAKAGSIRGSCPLEIVVNLLLTPAANDDDGYAKYRENSRNDLDCCLVHDRISLKE